MIETTRQSDGHLWMTALGLSVLINLGLLAGLGLLFLELDIWKEEDEIKPPPKPQVAKIYLQLAEPEPEPAVLLTPKAATETKPFARTSADQETSPEKTHERIGERSTRATSDAAPDAAAKLQPSQQGVEPEDGEVETTESRYQDGSLVETSPNLARTDPLPTPPRDALPLQPNEAVPTTTELVERGQDPEISVPPPRQELLQGPTSVDVEVQSGTGTQDQPKQTPTPAQSLDLPKEAVSEKIKPTPAEVKPFQGNQRKTAMVGSISRTGKSALNVDNTELGRYQAAISKAVELEWQRNCVRHRDFITPGFLTVRFFVEPNGKVRSVDFVGEMETGEVQKGFTLNSIRNAQIPVMPDALGESYAEEPLELLFRFYF